MRRKSTVMFLVCLGVFSALSLLPGRRLAAGSRLGRVTGVMGQVVSINVGRVHGITQGLRGLVFKFDKDRNTVDVAVVQVIGVSDETCLGRIVELKDSVAVGQYVDIEGTLPPRQLEKFNLMRQLEEDARNYFAVYRYTEPEGANCLAICRQILSRDPENRLARQLIGQMEQNYFQWAAQERNNGNFGNALIYYTRIFRLDPENATIYPKIWELLGLIDVEAQVPLDQILKGRPPDYYYASAEQYYRSGQFEKSNKFFRFLMDNYMAEDLAARDGTARNDRMLALMAELRKKQAARAEQEALAEQKQQAEKLERRKKLELARYYRTVGEDLFNKRDYVGALVYYLKLLENVPDDSLTLSRREFISRADMLVIPAGEFSRGSNTRELGEVMGDFGFNGRLYRELPKRWVYVDSFYIDRCEVTNGQYKRFVESTGRSCPLGWKDGKYPEGEDYFPVVYVSWLDARDYARWIGKRLPTEEEWEKSARGEDGYQWPWGDQFQASRCNVRESGKKATLPVGSLLSGASKYGVLDLAGNVWEWVNADLRPYPGYDNELFYFPSSVRKVIRGGSFREPGDQARGSFRGDGAVDQIYNNVGFRCVRDLRGGQETLGGL
jgi:formylglycine-generating enzyme required for sulfatase activity